MTEYSIYGKDGLFHNIVKKSAIMNGRYALLPKGGTDLNMNNVLSALELPANGKYPIVACLAPSSILPGTTFNASKESFNFTLFFLCRTHATGDNKIKKPDPNTNTSLHTIPMDWSDMKNVMLSFMNALEKLQKQLLPYFHLDQKGNWFVGRLSGVSNDNVSGVFIRFSAALANECDFTDIDFDAIELPINNHTTHFH